jgi:hypothetical protein
MDEAAARDALRAYVSVRMGHAPKYAPAAGTAALSREALISAVTAFAEEASDGGKRAQGLVAGLLDIAFGEERIITDRINSPSRRYPGDVCVLAEAGSEEIERAFEVKDKPVTTTDIQIFGRKCLDFAVRETAYVMVAEAQPKLDVRSIYSWANGLGLGLTLYLQWPPLVQQCLFWGILPSPDGAVDAVGRVRERLIAIEASPASVDRWERLVARAVRKPRSRARRASSFFVSHSHTTSTRQPSSRSSASLWASRTALRASFGPQYSVRDVGRPFLSAQAA